MQQLFSAKWVIPVDGPAIKGGAVVVEGDKIIAVGDAEELSTQFATAKRRDFGRSIILPGFVDLHTHLGFAAFRGVCDDLPYAQWKIQQLNKSRSLNESDWLISARLGAMEAVESGITTIADLTPRGTNLQAAIEFGLRGIVFYEMAEMDRTKVPSTLKEAELTVAGWRDLAANHKIEIGIAPLAPHAACPPLIRGCADWARRDGLKLCTHLAGSKDEYDFIKYGSSELAGAFREAMGWGHLLWQPMGVSPVKYLQHQGFFDNDVLAVHCVHLDDDDIRVLSDYDVAVAHCPKCSAKLAMGTAPLREFLEHGMRVGLGTDSPASNNMMDFFDEMRIGLLFQRARSHTIRQAEALAFVRMATLGGAEALGLEDVTGSLTVGKDADLVVVDMTKSHQRPLSDPYSALVYTANQENITLTMGSGKILYDSGAVPGVDSEAVINDVEPVRLKLSK